MKKVSSFRLVSFLSILLLLQACATGGSEKALSSDALHSITTIKAVRFQSPEVLKATTRSKSVAMAGMMFGALGGGIGGGLSYSMESDDGKKVAMQYQLPDFGKLVYEKMIDTISSDLPEWPKIEIQPNPVQKDFAFESGHYLVITTKLVRLNDGEGLSTVTEGQLKDSAGNVFWEKTVKYVSKEFNHCSNLEQLEAENGKLLKDEIANAAQQTVLTFLDHIKGKATGS